MNTRRSVVVVLLALLVAACGNAGTSPAGTMNVSLTAGPVCPVERFPPDPNCASRPVPDAEVIVLTRDGREVARVKSDAAGKISLRLPFGNYVLRPVQAPGGFPAAPGDMPVTVGAVPVDVALDYDTGIR